MRLLNTTAVQLHEFFDSDIPHYAILSHRWEDGEILFKDVTESCNLQASGWVKVRKSCEVAKRCGHDWLWVDTCCIDQSSSTELSEALNSMFNWYRDAEICLAYLCDVKKDLNFARPFNKENSQEHSVWFSRGWTLQELLAPKEMRFYDMDWSHLGTRSELVHELQKVTRIDAEYLCGGNAFRRACIATKMSWMANRTTKRKEDIAYAMLGIFNIYMTPQYGEGELASFVRLQEKLLTQSTDESLFAWKMNDDEGGTPKSLDLDGWERDEWGLLAPHPRCFKDSQCLTTDGETIPRDPIGVFSRTQKGIQISWGGVGFKIKYVLLLLVPGVNMLFLPIYMFGQSYANRITSFPLNCWQRDELGTVTRVQLYLRRCPKGSLFFKRYRCTEFKLDDKKMTFTRYRQRNLLTWIVLQPPQA